MFGLKRKAKSRYKMILKENQDLKQTANDDIRDTRKKMVR